MLSAARFILSRDTAKRKYEELKKLSDQVSYSYKTNPEVGRVLAENTESLFSIHSFESLRKLGCPSRVWFFAQAWTKQEIKELVKLGVDKFVVDNETDLDTLIDFIDESSVKISLLLRMRLKEHTIQTGKHYVYGMYSSRVNTMVPVLRKNKHVERLGIHFHRKTQNVSEWSLKEELEETISRDVWGMLDIVNIGGGMPAEYKNSRPEVMKSIFSEVRRLREWLNSMGIEMIIEPGRYIAAPSVVLEASIMNIYGDNIIINCSVYNCAMDTFVAHVRLLVEGEEESGEAYTIKGCTPDSMDIFRYRVYLKKPKKGDKIRFLNAGAYTYTTDFCNLQKLETKVI